MRGREELRSVPDSISDDSDSDYDEQIQVLWPNLSKKPFLSGIYSRSAYCNEWGYPVIKNFKSNLSPVTHDSLVNIT